MPPNEGQITATVTSTSPLHIGTPDGRTFPAYRLAGYQPEAGDLIFAIWADEHHHWVILGRIV